MADLRADIVPHWLRMDATDRWRARQMYVSGNLRGLAVLESERLGRLRYEMKAAKVDRVDAALLARALADTAPPTAEQVAEHYAPEIASLERRAADLARAHGFEEGAARTATAERLRTVEAELSRLKGEVRTQQAEQGLFWTRWRSVAQGRPEPLDITPDMVGDMVRAVGNVDRAGAALAKLLGGTGSVTALRPASTSDLDSARG